MAEATKRRAGPQHTPGPWLWSWRPGDDVNPGSVVAVGYPNAPGRPFSVAMCPRYRGPEHEHRWDADARLIAASPRLAQALTGLLDATSCTGDEPEVAEARKALVEAGYPDPLDFGEGA